MRQINLLPPELKPGKQFSLAVKKAEKYFVVLLITYLIMLGAGFYATNRLRKELGSYTAKKASLASELKSLVNVETSTVYIRDRVEKYKKLSGKDTELSTLKIFEDSFVYLPSGSKIDSININENTVSYNVSVPELISFSNLLANIIASGLYKEIDMSAVTYIKGGGYSFSLTMNY